MSRTIRRTRGRPHELYTFEDCLTRFGNEYWEFKYLYPGHPEYSAKYWELHADGRSGVYGVPRWYRAALNKKVFNYEEQRLRRALRTGQEDELVFNKRKRDAGYSWW